MKKLFPCALLIVLNTLYGCASQPEKLPDYIGSSCSFNEKSKIIDSYKFYAVCKNNKWKAISAENFKTYVIKTPEEQVFSSSVVMKDSDTQSGKCIYAKQYYNSFRDFDVDGKTIIRNPISQKSCVAVSCEVSNDIKEYDVRWCN